MHNKLQVWVLIFFTVMSLTTQAQESEYKIKFQPAYHAASYLQSVFDQLQTSKVTSKKKSSAKFCRISKEKASLYMQMAKAQIDQTWKEVPANELNSFLKYHATHLDQKCSEQCTCDFYYDIAEKIKELPQSKNEQIKMDPQYLPLYKKQNVFKCFAKSKNFCESKIFKEIAAQVQKND